MARIASLVMTFSVGHIKKVSMITIAVVWLCLATHVAYGTVITVSSSGDNTTDCCENGMCPCSSLSSALSHMQDDMVIDIVSNITLHDIVHIGTGKLNNITIAGADVAVMCNNSGALYCESCRDVIITGITWYECGTSYSNYTSTPALHFNAVSNMVIQYCTFQSSPGCPVYLNRASGRIIINGSNFIANAVDAFNTSCAGLYIYYQRNLDVSVYASKFDRNGCRLPNSCNHYSAIIFSLDEAFAMANIDINNTTFSYNSRALFLNCTVRTAIVKLSNVTVSNNTMGGVLIGNSYQYIDFPDIEILSSAFVGNVNPLTIILPPKQFTIVSLIKVEIKDSIFSNNVAIRNDDMGVTTSLGVLSMYYHPGYSVTMLNCYFYNNLNGAIDMQLISPVSSLCFKPVIVFTNVTVRNTTMLDNGNDACVSITGVGTFINLQFIDVNFTLNRNSRPSGEILHISNSNQKCMGRNVSFQFSSCNFDDNTAFGSVVTLKIMRNMIDPVNGALLNLTDCIFNNNYGGSNIVNIQSPTTSGGSFSHVTLVNAMLSNNKGTALYCVFTDLEFQENVYFINNTAISGSAIYFEQICSVLSNNADIQFINNSAVQRGGALYFDLVTTDHCNVFPFSFNASFMNNSADIAGNSIYFSIPQSCQISNATSTNPSLLYVPHEFSYSQTPYIMGSPVVTSPHNIKLYPPAEMVLHHSSNTYFIQQSKMLGEPIRFAGSALGHFNSVTEIVIFDINCKGCGDDYVLSTYQIAVHNESLIELKVFPTREKDVTNMSISLTFLSVLPPAYKSITATLLVELSPCHIGYLFDKHQRQCICYPRHDILHCTDDYIEIKIGYWVGYVSDYYTSSICPNDYCSFRKQTETNLGYYGLSRKSDVLTDNQCNSHRTGVACGKCKSGYTLAYDSPDCINTNKQCSAGITVLVVLLTVLYWFAVVAIVFCLMCLPFQKASALGYVFGIIYFYSIVDVLLINNVSEDVHRLVAILSSFAKLTPQLFGQLCFVKGLSGIDQQFIHYCHALAISLILLAIVLVARVSPRLLMHVNRHIISVICILLLLSYTSLTSTSLQLLRPLTFNDIDEVSTYSSPDIKYFTGRHLVYAIVALLCEVIIVIGLPLLLLLEPLLSRKVNFVRIKPLMDPFQHCYKDKYRWFGAYYLICRQVLILIVYVGNRNYYNMLYYLQTACIVIAMIHGYIQPYKSHLLNGLDGLILLIVVLVVNVNTFPSFSLSVSSDLSVVLVILPLLFFCFTAITKFVSHSYKRKKIASPLLNPAAEGDNYERRVSVNYNEIQESLLDYSDN